MLRILKCSSIPLLLTSSLFVSTFFSCSDNSKIEENTFNALNENLAKSNLVINKSSSMVLAELNEKLVDPASSFKAGIWLPKAQLIQKHTADIFGYIENFKSAIKKAGEIKEEKLNDFYNKLRRYKANLISVDSQMATVFDTSVILTSKRFELKKNSNTDFDKILFDGVSIEASLSLLSMIQNNAKIIENRMINFCNNKVAYFDDYHETYSVIIGQNTSYVRAGQKIEITAGVGTFSVRAKPDIKIKGQKVNINENGVAIMQIPASSKTGKHFIPVEINFTDYDGKRQTISKTVEYTVAKE